MKKTDYLKFSFVLLGSILVFLGMISFEKQTITLQEDLSIGVEYGDQNLMFGSVSDIQLDSEENIYIMDWENSRIQLFNPQGEFLRSIPIKKGQGPQEISMLLGFAVHPDGMISFFDRAGRKIVNYDNQGHFCNSFKINFQATDMKHYQDGNLALLGLNNNQGIHIFSREGERLSSFAKPFPVPSKLSQYKDMPQSRLPMKFDSSGDGKVFLLNPHKYEILIYKNGQLSGKIKGKSDFFRPMMILPTGEGEKKYLSIIFPRASVLEHESQTFITLRELTGIGEEVKSQMQIYENQKLLHNSDVKGFPYAVDSEGRLYFSAVEKEFPVMKRYKILFQ